MKKIILASGNAGKIVEIKDLFKNFPIQLISQSEYNVSDVEETGLTFIENALIKARYAAKCTHLPAIADDSGLVVNALNGDPGIYSARYAGKNASNEERIEKVLKQLDLAKAHDRTASFHCVIAYIRYEKDPTPIVAHGIWSGEILSKPVGDKGFGYDPIFLVPEYQLSAAELEPDLKNRISHRARAFEAFLEEFSHEMALSSE